MPEVTESGYVSFGEFKPDLRYLANDGLLEARNVVPAHGDYISAPAKTTIAAQAAFGVGMLLQGLHFAKNNGFGYVLTQNNIPLSDIFEVADAGAVTNRTRTAALNYAPMDSLQGTTFGSSVIAALWNNSLPATSEPVQLLTSGAARFVDMITSTFAPRAAYTFPLRGNLFLGKCYLAAPYDTLAAGLNDTLAAWSMSENIRAFGSFRANPELTGTGYQPLNYDLGEITAAVAGGGDYGIFGLHSGIVRVDGPPYTFRVITRDYGCVPSAGGIAMCAAGEDIYYVSPAGLCRLPGGEGPPEVIGERKFLRWLTDTAFHSDAFNGNLPSIAYDPVGGLLFLSYVHLGSGNHGVVVVYNTRENRASYWLSTTSVNAPRYLSNGRQDPATNWLPGRDMRFIDPTDNGYKRFGVGQSYGGDVVLSRGYMQLKMGQTWRFRRLRPVYAATNQAAIEQISITLESTNKPYATPVASGPFSTIDGHGWITCPSAPFADFCSPKFTMTANANMGSVVEYEGFEYEIELGPVYSA